jgi:hypothetical protein
MSQNIRKRTGYAQKYKTTENRRFETRENSSYFATALLVNVKGQNIVLRRSIVIVTLLVVKVAYL